MQAPHKAAIIDVGSNSCRMVIYEQAGAALLPYFNEKVMAALGAGLSDTGRLSVDGKAMALDTFQRFRAILAGLEITKVYAVATAAVREASDGVQFRTEAEAALGVPLRVLSGVDEGRLSALGVAAGFGKAKGLVADLGGSSLELQAVGKAAADRPGETYLLGPLARSADQELSTGKRRKIIAKILSKSALLPLKSGRLYAVGGAWRNVAVIHMALTGYPLGVSHAYRLDRAALAIVIDAAEAAGQDSAIKGQLQQIAKRRYGTLLHAALVLDGLLEAVDVNNVHISAYGLREGVLAEAGGAPDGDGLLDTAALYLKLSDASIAFGRQLHQFIGPVLEQAKQRPAVLRATCLMADAGARLHSDHRSELVFEQILRAPLPSLHHPDRLFTAFAVASRYTFKFRAPEEIEKILPAELRAQARLVGTAMRLGGVFSGRSAGILKTAKLNLCAKYLRLQVLSKNQDMISETVRRRHAQLAGLLDVEAVLETVASL